MTEQRVEFLCQDESQTVRLGTRLAALLCAGDVVSLVGDLGAGKTRLVRAIAESMGVEPGEATSPTFVLLQQYAGRLPLFHFDTYRLRDTDEFLELGAEELLYADGVCLIEWGDRVESVLPADHLRCEIEIAGANERRFRFTATGARSAVLLQALREGLCETARE